VIGQIFESEMKALRESDAVILLEPAGRSSLAEAGIACGMGKRVILVGPVEHSEAVLYRICGSRYPSIEAFPSSLS
jgi:nucleoside 2-deoxyribosyltransferase